MIKYTPNRFDLNGLEPEYLMHGVDWIANNFNIHCPKMHKNLQETAKYGFYRSFNTEESYGRNMALSDGIFTAVNVALHMFLEPEEIHIHTLSEFWVEAWIYAENKMKEIYIPVYDDIKKIS